VNTTDAVLAAEAAVAIGIDIAAGKFLEALKKTRMLADTLVLMVPVDQLKADLTERDRTFVDLEADVAEAIKLDSTK
jgi:hypothetical protein